MNNITEEDIERFVRYPDTLSVSRKKTIQDAISRNSEFQELVDWFTGYYEELDALESLEPTNTLISLRPIGKSLANTDESQPQVFAAMSSAILSGTMETVATLASEEEQTVARILRNREDGDYKFHLIRREEPGEDEKTILTIENLNMDLVLDQSRHLIVEGNAMLDDLDWTQAACSLRLPLERYRLGAHELKSYNLSKEVQLDNYQLFLEAEAGTMKCTIRRTKTDAPAITRVLITGPETKSRLIQLNGESSFRVQYEKSEALTIHFYR